jgi:hypothetical protein
MKKYSSVISILILCFVAYWSYCDLMPSQNYKHISNTGFSIDNALAHLKEISKSPHYTGSKNHLKVQTYIAEELKKMGLNPKIQQQVVVNDKWRTSTNVANIIASIKGTESGKSLVLLSHYDSRHHSSFGASDAGSGVVTILEGVRAFLSNNETPKNDIHIVFTDAEEIGLLGAKAFVDKHPLAKNIGLVINLEARGSGGPSYMLMETNGKNSQLLFEFINAKPNYPAANSLMYSIYKMLPNDTDLTVFRENGNINGLNFAFIGDHFDYHTEQDSFERLDRETLFHQADYLMTILNYFSNSDLSNLNSNIDEVYTNFPFTTLLHFPFSWILNLLIISILIFVALVLFGIYLNKITINGLFKGFIPFIVSLILCTVISKFLWDLILILHPNYNDILHGFTYNGYQYIIAFSLLNLWIFFKIYNPFFKKYSESDLLISPIVFWIIINSLIYIYLKGAAYFIIPVYFSLITFGIFILFDLDKNIKIIFSTFLAIPLIYIFAPLFRMFPVGLGLSNLFIVGFFIVLIFSLLIPIFVSYKSRRLFVKLIGFSSLLFFLLASLNSNFNENKRKPNSIVFINDIDKNESFWASYDHDIDSFTRQFFKDSSNKDNLIETSSRSKYNNSYNFYKKTSNRKVKPSDISIIKDTINGDFRHITLIIKPQRIVNKFQLITNESIKFNDIAIQDVFISIGNSKTPSEIILNSNKTILTYYYTPVDKHLKIDLTIDRFSNPNITVIESSFDLLNNPLFDIKPRANYMMTMPFVTNDAIITKQKLNL